MLIWTILATIFLAGAIGGVINALMTDNGFVLPKFEKINGILRPGLLGNVLIGAVAAVISWGLYGPFTNYAVISAPPPAPPPGGVQVVTAEPSLTIAAFVGAILIGIAGAKWLSNEVDKKLVKAAAATAAAAGASPSKSAEIMAATPAKALEIAQAL